MVAGNTAKRRVAVLSTGRADYGIVSPVARLLRDDSRADLRLWLTGRAPRECARELASDGFDQVAFEISGVDGDPDGRLGAARSVGQIVQGVASAMAEQHPDLLLLAGDRFETHAAATAATLMGVPIAHLHGGEVTYGAFDDALRHSITKLSHLHFTACEAYRARVIQMGEAASRVFAFGAPSLDVLHHEALLSQEEVELRAGLALRRPTFLVTLHPETLHLEGTLALTRALVGALESFPTATCLITLPNADPSNQVIRDELQAFALREKDRSYVSAAMGSRFYLSAMKYADVVVGNSSSGLLEAPSLGVPCVNIGQRQQGRLRAPTVIDAPASVPDIVNAIARAMSGPFRETIKGAQSPFDGGGESSRRITEVLLTYPLEGILRKEFVS